MFYVTDLTNKKITSPQRQKAIRERLLEVLGGDAERAGAREPAASIGSCCGTVLDAPRSVGKP